MSTLSAKQEANKEGKFHSVEVSFRKIFSHQGLAAKVVEAVHLVTPLLTEGSLLANLRRWEWGTAIQTSRSPISGSKLQPVHLVIANYSHKAREANVHKRCEYYLIDSLLEL